MKAAVWIIFSSGPTKCGVLVFKNWPKNNLAEKRKTKVTPELRWAPIAVVQTMDTFFGFQSMWDKFRFCYFVNFQLQYNYNTISWIPMSAFSVDSIYTKTHNLLEGSNFTSLILKGKGKKTLHDFKVFLRFKQKLGLRLRDFSVLFFK